MNNKLHKIIPVLRFSEFSDEWKEKNLEEIAEFYKGKGISKADVIYDGKNPCIRYGELYTLYNEIIECVNSYTNISNDNLVLSRANDVIIPASGETKEDIATASCVINSGVILGGDLNIIRSKINGVFLSYYLNSAKKKSISQLAQGISVVHLYSSQLKKLIISFPNIKEQQKIADCLSSLDDLISTQSKKITALQQHKKGLMQDLFPADGETCPKLRFPEFQNASEWKFKELNNCLDYLQPTPYLVNSTAYNDKYKIPVLTAGKTFVLGYTNETHGIFDKKLPVIIFDDFTTASKYVDFPFKAKSSAMKILLAKNGFNIKFCHEALQKVKYEVGSHQRHWIAIFSKLNIPTPSFAEQQKIADCLSSLDNLISTQIKKLTALQQHKKGLMQNIFPIIN